MENSPYKADRLSTLNGPAFVQAKSFLVNKTKFQVIRLLFGFSPRYTTARVTRSPCARPKRHICSILGVKYGHLCNVSIVAVRLDYTSSEISTIATSNCHLLYRNPQLTALDTKL